MGRVIGFAAFNEEAGIRRDWMHTGSRSGPQVESFFNGEIRIFDKQVHRPRYHLAA